MDGYRNETERILPLFAEEEYLDFSSQDLDTLKAESRLEVVFDKESLEGLIGIPPSTGLVDFYPLVEAGQMSFKATTRGSVVKSVTAQVVKFISKAIQEEMLLAFTQQSKWLFSKVSFDSSRLNTLLENASGITMYSSVMDVKVGGNLDSYYTLTAVPNESTSGASGVTSLLPCPPNCGDGSYQNKGFNAMSPPAPPTG